MDRFFSNAHFLLSFERGMSLNMRKIPALDAGYTPYSASLLHLHMDWNVILSAQRDGPLSYKMCECVSCINNESKKYAKIGN